MSSSRVYVGNLPIDAREREIEDLFYKASRVKGAGEQEGAQGPPCAHAWCAILLATKLPSSSTSKQGEGTPCMHGAQSCWHRNHQAQPCATTGKPHPSATSPQYGRIRSIDLKTPARPPAFAFIEFGEYTVYTVPTHTACCTPCAAHGLLTASPCAAAYTSCVC